MCKRTQELTKKSNRLITRVLRADAYRTQFLQNILKVCPNCGTLNQLDAKGCVNCLFQFNKERKNVDRLGTKRIES